MKRNVIQLIVAELAIISFWVLVSCTDAEKAKIGGLGDQFKIELMNCDGTVGRTWISTGKVSSEKSSDGYYFMDQESGKLIEVSGTLVITKL